MMRLTTLLWIALLIVAGGTVMRVSYQVRHVQEHLADLGRDIQREQDSLRILNAEWNTLNDPLRIDTLSKRYLPLVHTPIQRVVALTDIPMKPTADQLTLMAAASAKKAAKDRADGKAQGPVLQAKATVPAPGPRTPSAIVPISATSGVMASAPPAGGLIQIRAERRE